MILEDSIKKASYMDEKKIAVSLRLPISLRDKLLKITNEKNISFNSLVISILERVLEDDPQPHNN
jgi:hypothetical protein